MKLKFVTIAVLAVILLLPGSFAIAEEMEALNVTGNAVRFEGSYYTLDNSWTYTLIHEFVLQNEGASVSRDIELTIPLMDEPMPLYMEKQHEQLNPWPDEIRTLDDGHRVAVYWIEELQPGAELTFTQKYLVEAYSISYPDLSLTAGPDYRFDEIDPQYLNPSPGIQSNHMEIRAFAQEAITKGNYVETNPYQMAREAFSAVSRYLDYEKNPAHDNQRSALDALRRGTGLCEDYTNLLVAVLRALGIPARVMSGYLYIPGEHLREPYFDADSQAIDLAELRHTWVEFYAAELGWVVADPTSGTTMILNGEVVKLADITNYFAKITDYRRYIYFREGDASGDSVTFTYTGGSLREDNAFSCYLQIGNQTSPYNDTEGHWAEADIAYLSTLDTPLMQGLGDGLFGVGQSLTRAQLVTTLQRQMKSPASRADFNDLTPGHWAYADIGAAQNAGWISGYPDGSFRPNQAVTRAEMAQLLVRVFDLQLPPEVTDEPDEDAENAEPAEKGPDGQDDDPRGTAEMAERDVTESLQEKEPDAEGGADEPQAAEQEPGETDTPAPAPAFLDLGRPGYAWADEAIEILAALGLVEGAGGGYFQPERSVTRAEFAAVLARTLRYVEQLAAL